MSRHSLLRSPLLLLLKIDLVVMLRCLKPLPLFRLNIRTQFDAGVHGFILGGTLGEASTLTLDEKEILEKQK